MLKLSLEGLEGLEGGEEGWVSPEWRCVGRVLGGADVADKRRRGVETGVVSEGLVLFGGRRVRRGHAVRAHN